MNKEQTKDTIAITHIVDGKPKTYMLIVRDPTWTEDEENKVLCATYNQLLTNCGLK